MCGFAGFLRTAPDSSRDCSEALVTRMSMVIQHRGPDDSGVWTDDEAGIALAHRRLSIIDVSTAGHQPMHSPCGRYVLVFNGEIYNHFALRAELLKAGIDISWRGHSDTETLLAGFSVWGVKATLYRAVGMFSCSR